VDNFSVFFRYLCYNIGYYPDKLEDRYLRQHKKEFREDWYLPKGIDFNNTIVVYDNKVAIISSKKESYGFIVESDELAGTMMTLIKML